MHVGVRKGVLGGGGIGDGALFVQVYLPPSEEEVHSLNAQKVSKRIIRKCMLASRKVYMKAVGVGAQTVFVGLIDLSTCRQKRNKSWLASSELYLGPVEKLQSIRCQDPFPTCIKFREKTLARRRLERCPLARRI
jgi:hypothetical protein